MTYAPPAGILLAPPGAEGPRGGDHIGVVLPTQLEELEIAVMVQKFTGPGIMLYGFHRVDDPNTDTTLRHVTEVYFGAEVARRQAAGQANVLPVKQALIVFPRSGDGERRVQLNDEVQVLGQVSLKYGTIAKGEELTASAAWHYTAFKNEYITGRMAA